MTSNTKTEPFRALVVDDEPLAVDALVSALEQVEGLELVGTCAGGREAVDAIREQRPDVVFLDVQMPGLDGFGVIQEIGPAEMPEVVFVTAYDEHALRAFEVHALDYVLKPFDDDRLDAAVRHALDRLRGARTNGLGHALDDLLSGLAGSAEGRLEPPGHPTRVMVREADRIFFVEVDDVDWIEAAGNYVCLHVGQARHLIRTTLTELARRLDARSFVRIHRSTIVNVSRIREIQPWVGGDYIAFLHDGQQLKVSRNFRDALLKPLS